MRLSCTTCYPATLDDRLIGLESARQIAIILQADTLKAHTRSLKFIGPIINDYHKLYPLSAGTVRVLEILGDGST